MPVIGWKIRASKRDQVVRYLMTNLPEIAPDDAILRLRDVYVSQCRIAGCCREKFTGSTKNMEEVKRVLGPSWSHIPVDDLRHLITTCAKMPGTHGGGWNAVKGID